MQGPDGAPAAHRVHRHGYPTDAELASELTWAAALREAGIGAPGILWSRSGALFEIAKDESVPEPRQVDLLEWFEGRSLGSVEEGLSSAVTDAADTLNQIRQPGAAFAQSRGRVAAAGWLHSPYVGRRRIDGRGALLGAILGTPRPRRLAKHADRSGTEP